MIESVNERVFVKLVGKGLWWTDPWRLKIAVKPIVGRCIELFRTYGSALEQSRL
jgi:hypothetical protein